MEAMVTEGGALEDMVAMAGGMGVMAEVMEVTAIMERDPPKLKQVMAMVAMVDIAQEDMEALEDMVAMATEGMEVMEAMALAGMEVMGTARDRQILAMSTVAAVATEVTAGVMVVIEVMATMAEANQIQMMMTRILREYQ